MRRDALWLVLLLAVIAVFGYWAQPAPEKPEATPSASATPTPAETATPSIPDPSPLVALCGPPSKTLRTLKGVKAPALTEKVTVLMETNLGHLRIEVYPQAAPRHAQRFLELVEKGYYDGTPIFRVVPGFVCQFGLNSRFGKQGNISDDPSLFCLERGTVCFAKSGMPDSATTQIFINYAEWTEQLVPEPGGKGPGIFTAFAKVVSGMEVAEKFRTVGDPQMGLDQGELSEDTDGYLRSLPKEDKPNMIQRMRIVR